MYLIEVSVTTSGTAKAITSKTDLDAALMSLHQTMASAMANANVSSCLCMVIDQYGAVIRNEYWARATT